MVTSKASSIRSQSKETALPTVFSQWLTAPSPRPVPFPTTIVLKNGSKMRGRIVLGIPEPLSLIPTTPRNVLSRSSPLLATFAGAFDRCELCAMKMSDLCFSATGLMISVLRSKAIRIGQTTRSRSRLARTATSARSRRSQDLRAANLTEGAVFRGIDRHGHVSSTGLHRDRSDLQNHRGQGSMNETDITGPGSRWDGNASCVQRILRAHYCRD